MAVLTAAGTLGTVSSADAALFYSSDSGPGVADITSSIHRQQHKSRRHSEKAREIPAKEVAKPQGPLVIAISIDQQKLRIYDDNGMFAETPISTGMRGHPTPMGVFSVIEKDRLHHSNIYSGAPMPYMQRITWSGIAIHAGVLPGYPASHGCIRMPMAFAVKMWSWTRMGARVVVTPGELSPSSFSHPLLVTNKTPPQPVAAEEPTADAPTAVKSDKVTASADLTTGVHNDASKPPVALSSASVSLREQTHTADASGTLPVIKDSATMSDAAPARDAGVANTQADAAKPETAKSEPKPAKAEPTDAAAAPDKPAETKAADSAIPEMKPSLTDAADKSPAPSPAQTGSEAVNAAASADEGIKAEEPKIEAKTLEVKTLEVKTLEIGTPEIRADDIKPETLKTDISATTAPIGEKPIESPKAVAADTAQAKKDQARLDAEKKTAMKPAAAPAPKRAGQIAVFVSRKDAKLYVRQNFTPLFDVPVTIAPSDRPLGTHVFTAEADKDDANVLHWSVVSLPASARNAERRDDDDRPSRKRKTVAAAETKPAPVPDSPTEALDRLSIPADAMSRITEMLSTGGSLIISDQGITAGETGEGTDFIVSLR